MQIRLINASLAPGTVRPPSRQVTRSWSEMTDVPPSCV